MDEDVKQRVISAVLAFNLVIITYQVIFNWQFTIGKFAIGAVIAGLAAAATYFGLGFTKK